jgi:hypothetical protein
MQWISHLLWSEVGSIDDQSGSVHPPLVFVVRSTPLERMMTKLKMRVSTSRRRHLVL